MKAKNNTEPEHEITPKRKNKYHNQLEQIRKRYQLQPNAEVSQIVGVTAVGNESLGAFLEKSRQFLFQKLGRQHLLHLSYSTAQTNEGIKVNLDPNIQESGEV